ncbi:class I SAM-dependent methyltransferase [Streptomyces sp. HNM0574]|uniref:class I SAM-dependent methyltransferase n=1 Tax=Streptomyces sp. HNM0574 TaxID=2714954 RepID=UPI00146C7578|nr:class I SAM-dependent methyltransferase [Streptomyces sp. HNM0574]NLU70038.1 class I SAM-dependent methyltransferase [Streptomyces sp. HNM0574]
MFTPEGPTVRELAVQALSSVERGYDLLAPKFDQTPFRTPDAVLDAVTDALAPFGPFRDGLDLCCGTGAGTRVLRELCEGRTVGADLSEGMLTVARTGTGSGGDWVRADALALPFRSAFDLVVSFGAFGHFLPSARPALFAQAHGALRPGGRFAFPVAAPPPVRSWGHWALLGFDVAMRVRNALWRPPFVMYYRTFPLGAVRRDLAAAGFGVDVLPLPRLGLRPDGSPRCALVVATRPR